ncbi:arf-GAP with SH3 domain, ANK repeat and PH domain-containing protein 1 [Camelus ferus]|nr:arf-GAP with SH3 domain, ANK repeat and PH domain-containing protein 1 [Camelus ferus]
MCLSSEVRVDVAKSNRQPAKLNLLTCQVKPNAEDKKSFDLISHNRTYHFQAEDEQDYVAWISVLTNSKEEALTMAFRGEQSTGENSLEDLTKAIIEDVQRLPGNDVCCDCGSSAKLNELLEAIKSRDLLALIQVYAEGVELMEPLLEPGQELGETALHLAVRTADQTSLHLVDFLVQNCGNLDKQTALGNTALHYCSMYGKPECLKLLLRSKPTVDVVNQAGETALDIAKRLKATQCEDLLSQAKSGKFNPHVHVEYEWNLRQEEMDESDDDLDDKDKLSLPGFSTPRDKQRLSYGAFTNQIFVSTSTDSPTSPTAEAPPLPPRNTVKGEVRGGAAGIMQTGGLQGNDVGPSSSSKTANKFEGLSQQSSCHHDAAWFSHSAFEHMYFSRVHERFVSVVALRKTETSHHLSLDKSSIPPEIFQKSSQLAELPQKPPPGDLPPKPTELAPKPQIGDLPPKPGELPPKPQLGDLPPKPQLSDLPPKPQMKDLPPKPQLGDLLAKPQTGDASPKAQPPELTPKSHPAELSSLVQRQASEDANDLTPTLPETPVPLPRKINTGKSKVRRVKTIYDCQADNDDELTFVEGEVIVVTGEEDQEWWIGHIEGQPERKGVFPVSFVHILSD